MIPVRSLSTRVTSYTSRSSPAWYLEPAKWLSPNSHMPSQCGHPRGPFGHHWYPKNWLLAHRNLANLPSFLSLASPVIYPKIWLLAHRHLGQSAAVSLSCDSCIRTFRGRRIMAGTSQFYLHVCRPPFAELVTWSYWWKQAVSVSKPRLTSAWKWQRIPGGNYTFSRGRARREGKSVKKQRLRLVSLAVESTQLGRQRAVT